MSDEWSVDATEHIARFIASFIRRDRQDRWTHLLLERPDKAASELHKLGDQLDLKQCKELSHRDDVLKPMSERGGVQGMYYDGNSPPQPMSSDEVETMQAYPSDGIFSTKAGAVAYFFNHDGSCWMCRS